MMKKFSDKIYVSGFNEVNDISSLKELGINAIVNVAYDISDPFYPPNELVLVKVGLFDSDQNPESTKSIAVEVVKRLVGEGKVVLVHCAAGVSRSPYIACRAICEMEGIPIDQVYDEQIAKYTEAQVWRMTPLRTNTYIPIGA